jgi:hypothetical protein
MLMRWRTSFAWALAGSVVLAFLLVLAAHPAMYAGGSAGMSAPAPFPARCFESASAVQLLQPQFDGDGRALRALTCSLTIVAVRAPDDTRQDAGTTPPHYGPLHRRPPPSLS